MSQIRTVANGKIGTVHVLMASACQFMSNHKQRFQNSIIFYWANMLISYLKDLLHNTVSWNPVCPESKLSYLSFLFGLFCVKGRT